MNPRMNNEERKAIVQACSHGYAQTAVLIWIVLLLSTIPAWLTHVIVCINDEKWLFLIAGAIMAPIAIIHGWGVWLGFF